MGKAGKIFFFLSAMSLVGFAVVKFLLGTWVPFLWVALGLFGLFLIVGVFFERKFFIDFFSMKTTKQGMSMGATILLTLILLVAINFISARKYKTFDFSLAQVNTLSDQSVKLVKNLDADMRVIFFYTQGAEGVEMIRKAFIDLIRKYQDHTSNMKLEFVEINEQPKLAQEYDVQRGSQVVYLDYKGRKAKIENINEQAITSALVKVTREKDKKIYFLTGHGEYTLASSGDGRSVANLKQLLEDNRYQVQNFNLTTSSVPSDADMVFIVGPHQQLLDVEVKALEAYLKSGGGLVLALEAGQKVGLDSFLSQLGIKLEYNYIATALVTPFGMAIDPRFAQGSTFSSAHEITKPFGNDQFTLFRMPTEIARTGNTPQGLTLEDIVKTGNNSVASKDSSFKGENKKGPFTVGVAVKGKFPGDTNSKEFSMVVFGDADFMNDQYFRQNLNRDLILNTAASLAKEENLISITPKEIGTTQIDTANPSFKQKWLLFIISFIGLPVLLFLASGVLWFKRRYA